MCVCLRILASSRITRYDLGRQTPHFWGGSVTARPQFFPISFAPVQTSSSASPPPSPLVPVVPSRPSLSAPSHSPPSPYPQELPGVVTTHRDALVAVENLRLKAFSTTHHRQVGMVSPTAPRVPRRAPQASRVLVPTASPCLIGRATSYDHTTLSGRPGPLVLLGWASCCGLSRAAGQQLPWAMGKL
jgi:hypothetical protein